MFSTFAGSATIDLHRIADSRSRMLDLDEMADAWDAGWISTAHFSTLTTVATIPGPPPAHPALPAERDQRLPQAAIRPQPTDPIQTDGFVLTPVGAGDVQELILLQRDPLVAR
jgi:hypothetical protein